MSESNDTHADANDTSAFVPKLGWEYSKYGEQKAIVEKLVRPLKKKNLDFALHHPRLKPISHSIAYAPSLTMLSFLCLIISRMFKSWSSLASNLAV